MMTIARCLCSDAEPGSASSRNVRVGLKVAVADGLLLLHSDNLHHSRLR